MTTNTSLNDSNTLAVYGGGKRLLGSTSVGEKYLYTYVKDGQKNSTNRTCGPVSREFYPQNGPFNPTNGPAGQQFSTGYEYMPSSSHYGNRVQNFDIHLTLQNTSGTDTCVIVNPWWLFTSFRMLFNNTTVNSSKADLYTGRDLWMLYCMNMLKHATNMNETRENFYRLFGSRTATTGITIAPGASIDIIYPLTDIFPGLRDYIIGKTFNGRIVFQFNYFNPTAVSTEGLINSTAATNPASFLRVAGCRLETIEQAIQGEQALSVGSPTILLRVPRFSESYATVDMSVLSGTAPNVSFRLSSVTPNLARYVFFFVRDVTSSANNHASAGKTYSGMNYLRVVMTKAGETTTILDQRDASSSAAWTGRFYRQQFSEVIGRSYPGDLLEDASDAAIWREYRLGHLLTHINLSGVENGPHEECIGGVSLPVTGAVTSDPDITFDVYPAAASVLPAASRVHMVVWDERIVASIQKGAQASQLVELDLLNLART